MPNYKKVLSVMTVTNYPTLYHVGKEVHGKSVAYIKDETIEWEDHIDFIYTGYDSESNMIFQVVNAPVEVVYLY